MAMLFMDSFDYYATAQLPSRGWVGQGTGYVDITAAAGRRGSAGLYMHMPNNSITPVWNWNPSADLTVTIGMAIKWVSAGMAVTFGNSAACVKFALNANGSITVTVTNGGTTATTAIALISTGVWYYLELQVYLHVSAGTVALRINGVDAIVTMTGQHTQNGAGSLSYVSFNSVGTQPLYIDDFYVLDTSGSINNNFLGDVRVDAHYPVTPDGTHHDWVPSSGVDNFAVVDEVTPNITDYNATNVLNALDTFNVDHLKNPGGTIKAIQTAMFHSKSDAGACLVAPVLRSGGTDNVGSDVAPSADSYLYKMTVYEQNPNGPAAWDETAFNAIEAGYKKTG